MSNPAHSRRAGLAEASHAKASHAKASHAKPGQAGGGLPEQARPETIPRSLSIRAVGRRRRGEFG
jgi:hypothetical protein